MDIGPHGFFILAAYAVSGVILLALILQAVLDYRAQLASLAELESRGARRRSEALPTSDRERPDPRGPMERLGISGGLE